MNFDISLQKNWLKVYKFILSQTIQNWNCFDARGFIFIYNENLYSAHAKSVIDGTESSTNKIKSNLPPLHW